MSHESIHVSSCVLITAAIALIVPLFGVLWFVSGKTPKIKIVPPYPPPKRARPDPYSWRLYFRKYGVFLIYALISGGGLGAAGIGGHHLDAYLRNPNNRATREVEFVEYRGLDIGDQPSYRELDTGKFNHIAVYAKALTPDGSTICIQLVPDQAKPPEQCTTAFESGNSSGTELQENISAKRLTLVIGSLQAGAKRASKADVIVFLSHR